MGPPMEGWQRFDTESNSRSDVDTIERECFDVCEGDWLRTALAKRGIVKNSDVARERTEEVKRIARQNEPQAEAVDRECVTLPRP